MFSRRPRGDIIACLDGLQYGVAGYVKGFVVCFLEVPLAWSACQLRLQFSPAACGTLRKHVTKPFPQPAAPDCAASID